MSNSSASASASTGGIGVLGLTTIVLLVFKLAGMAGASWGLANLSWFWVFAPILFGIGMTVVFLIGFLIVAVLVAK